jgi:hypothetical protein
MKPIDILKAAGVAVLLLVLNVLIAILVVLAYSVFIDPGHPREYYDEAAQRIVPWCSYISGTALFFIAGYYFSRRNPARNGVLFAVTFTVLYAIIDGATVGFAGVFSIVFGLSMMAKLLAGVAGAFLATRNPKARS